MSKCDNCELYSQKNNSNYGVICNGDVDTENCIKRLQNLVSKLIKMSKKVAFAVYSADDKSLTFYNREFVPVEGEIFEGKTVTAVYTGFDTGNDLHWREYARTIKSVSVADDGVAPISTAWWFYNFKECTLMDLAKLDTSKVTDMDGMFSDCKALISLRLTGWDVSKVDNMHSMFEECSSLNELDLTGWDTNNVTDMGYMFSGCIKLKKITLGEKWSFKGYASSRTRYSILPTPNSEWIPDADGKWYNAYNVAFTPSILRNHWTSDMAGTYYAYNRYIIHI